MRQRELHCLGRLTSLSKRDGSRATAPIAAATFTCRASQVTRQLEFNERSLSQPLPVNRDSVDDVGPADRLERSGDDATDDLSQLEEHSAQFGQFQRGQLPLRSRICTTVWATGSPRAAKGSTVPNILISEVARPGLFIPAGYWFGNLPFVKKQFHYVILVIIVLSVLPAVIEILREWRARGRRAASPPLPPKVRPRTSSRNAARLRTGKTAAHGRFETRCQAGLSPSVGLSFLSDNWFSSSFSSSLIPFLKERMPSPKPLPTPASR